MSRIIVLMIGLSLCSCKSNDVAPEAYADARIVFGHGGGYTGQVSRFCLLDNGMLYKKMHQDTGYVYQDKIKKNTGIQLISNYKTLGFNKLSTNKPGNVYRFLEYYDGDEHHRLTWDPYQGNDIESLNNYYNTLTQLIIKSNDKK